MPLNATPRRKRLLSTADRTKGERFQLSGSAVAFVGSVPRDLEVAFAPDGDRYPAGLISHARVVGTFTELWLFHRPASLPTATLVEMFEVLIFDDGLELAGERQFVSNRFVQSTNDFTAAGFNLMIAGTPGWRFRVFGFSLFVSGDATTAVAGRNTIYLLSQPSTYIAHHSVYMPAASAGVLGGWSSPWHSLPEGIPTEPDKALGVYISTALATGIVSAVLEFAIERTPTLN